jgi:hypothetical protein
VSIYYFTCFTDHSRTTELTSRTQGLRQVDNKKDGGILHYYFFVFVLQISKTTRRRWLHTITWSTSHKAGTAAELPLLRSLISNRVHQAATFLEVTELIMVAKSGPCKHQKIVKHFADQRLCSSKGFTTNTLHVERRDEYTILFDTWEWTQKICRQMTFKLQLKGDQCR